MNAAGQRKQPQRWPNSTMRNYLDHNATTPVRPDVIKEIAEVMAQVGNPSSVHADGQAARRRVEVARQQVGRAVCARPEDVIFTSGGTEALNLALHSVTQSVPDARLLVSAIEHEAASRTAQHSGHPVEEIPVTSDGVIDLVWLESRLGRWDESVDGRPVLVLMLANNEIGTVQPVADAARLVKARDGLAIVDAVQAIGKIPVDFAGLGVDYMAVSAHKFGGPQGVGALVAACDAPVVPHHYGGGQEKNRRAGTLNVAGIAGMGLAIEQAVAELDEFRALSELRDRMAQAVKAAAPGTIVLGESAERLPNTLGLAVPGWERTTQVMAMDLAGVSISAGPACSSGTPKGSRIGAALGLDQGAANGVIRVSLGWNSTPDEADAFVTAWTEAYARIASTLEATA